MRKYALNTVRQVAQWFALKQLSYTDRHVYALSAWLRVRETFPDYKHPSNAKLDVATVRALLRSNVITLGDLKKVHSGALSVLLSHVENNATATATLESARVVWHGVAGPENYMRATTLPTQHAIQQAEQTCAEFGITEADFQRVFLMADQIPESAYLWKPSVAIEHRRDRGCCAEEGEGEGECSQPGARSRSTSSSLFSSVPTRQDDPDRTMTFEKLLETIQHMRKTTLSGVRLFLHPHAASPSTQCYPIYHLITGAPDSFSFMPWQRGDNNKTNRASWFTCTKGYTLQEANLDAGLVEVTSIFRFPNAWPSVGASEHAKFGTRTLLRLAGCKCNVQRAGRAGLLVPELAGQ